MNICEKCDRKFPSRSRLTKHLNKIKPCAKYECHNCQEIFYTKTSFNKHMISRICINIQLQEMEQKMEEKINEKINEIKNEPRQIINNTTNNINNNNGVQIFVTPNEFGLESCRHITKEMREKLVCGGISKMPEFARQVFFNKDHPENYTVYYPNKRSKDVLVKGKDQYLLKDAEETSYFAILRCTNYMEKHIDDMMKENRIPLYKINNFDRDISCVIYKGTLAGERELLLLQKKFLAYGYDHKDIIKETYNGVQKDYKKKCVEERNKTKLLNK